MKQNTKLYISKHNDPFFNLALENEILLELGPHDRAVLVYSNVQSIVYGRFQNPWLECDLDAVKKSGTVLARRQSGGGCVYHDLGNLNFCFLFGEKNYYKELNNVFLCEMLEHFNIDAFLSERSDILVKVDDFEYKISGSAFKQKKDRSFHHCTFLIDANLDKLNSYLKSKLTSISTKSTRSNPRAVINLGDINNLITKESIIDYLTSHIKSLGGEVSEISDLKSNEYLKDLQSWKWIFGETPLFQIEVEAGEDILVNTSIRKGLFHSLEVIGQDPEVHPLYFDIFIKKLCGVELIRGVLTKVLGELGDQYPEAQQFNKRFFEALSNRLSL